MFGWLAGVVLVSAPVGSNIAICIWPSNSSMHSSINPNARTTSRTWNFCSVIIFSISCPLAANCLVRVPPWQPVFASCRSFRTKFVNKAMACKSSLL
ncbi:hypothetical protein BGX38DRAFT_1154343 [Terfezia claveryi]|nr:hypothetical protein BGX38DRAFT_1154343 [Terfezia claveryi]